MIFVFLFLTYFTLYVRACALKIRNLAPGEVKFLAHVRAQS